MKAEYVQHCGSDLVVVNAARVSFDKESDWEQEGDSYLADNGLEIYDVRLADKDKKLINYLAKHNHFTPFTHCTITLRETVPICIARQRFKHTVGFSYNEVSRRYVDDEPKFFVPDVWRSRPDGSVKQGSGDAIERDDQIYCDEQYLSTIALCEEAYDKLLVSGVAPEQARMVLPQSMYTSYYVTGSLAAWARAYKLRIDSHAQKEIQDLAKMWYNIISPIYPVSWEALVQ